MRVGPAGAHLGGDPDRLHQLLLGRTPSQGGTRVALDAELTLRDVRDGHRDQLLGLLVEGAVGEDLAAERLEGLMRLGGEVAPPVPERGFGGLVFVHEDAPCLVDGRAHGVRAAPIRRRPRETR